MAGTKIGKIYEPLKAKKINIKRWTGDISLNVSLSIPEKKSTLKNVIQSLNMEYPSDNPYAHFFSK